MGLTGPLSPVQIGKTGVRTQRPSPTMMQGNDFRILGSETLPSRLFEVSIQNNTGSVANEKRIDSLLSA